MAGELWTGKLQIGKETVAGTPVAATRILYGRDPQLSRARDPRPYQFSTGTRDNVRGLTLGPAQVGGSLTLPLSSSEIIEWLLLGIKGGVTPTTPAGTVRLWAFTPSGSGVLDSATVEWHDGARPWQAAGVRVNSLTFSGNVDGENTLAVDLFGMVMVQNALTGSLADRTPDYLEGWETSLYIDNFGATPGTTVKNGVLKNWNVQISNNLGRKYLAQNSLNASGVPIGVLDITASFTFEAAAAQSLTEFTNWDAATKRLVRLEFGQNEVIETTYKKFVTIDLPGAWTAVGLGGEDAGTRMYEFSYQYVYDPTNAYGLQIRAQNARATAY